MSVQAISKHPRQLIFRKPFDDRYTLQVKTDVLAGSIPIKTTTEIRWDLKVIEVGEEGSLIELLTLDHELVASNNPNLKELARMSQSFSRMYSELELLIGHDGQVKDVLNIDMISKKWAQTKSELQQMDEESDALKGIIILNDELFTTREKMVTAIQGNEFFSIYFNLLYGRKLPAETAPVKKWNHFQQAEVQWQHSVQPSVILPTNESRIEIEITGQPVTRFTKDWVKKAYSAFPNIDLGKLTPRMIETGKYTVDPSTGKLIRAYLLKEEVAHPQLLFSRLEYILSSDEERRRSERETRQRAETMAMN